jgi:predicted glycosyltransferase/CheY-like chemotaxis protein
MTRRVLIVEDEMVVQLHLARIVEELGCEVVGLAADRDEAMRLAAQRRPELVLMDIHLASGTDGVDTATRLTREHDCAVIFISAYADQATIDRTAAVGAAGYLVKPFTPAQVRAAIATAFASHRRLQQEKGRASALVSLLQPMGGAVFVVDREGRITFASHSAAELTGWPVHQTYGRDFLEAVGAQAGGERVRAAMAQAIAGGASQSAELQVPLPGGGARTFDVAMEVLADSEAEPGVLLRVGSRAPGSSAVPAPAPVPAAPAPRAFGAGTRMLVYSHDTFGLGHLRRCTALIRSVCARHPDVSVLLVTGSPMVHRYAMPRGSDYVKLPALVKVEAEQYEARSLQISSEAIQSLRSSLILHTVRDYRPNVLLVDHSPTGSMGELLPSLRWLQERGGCQRILGLRDIVDDPAAVTALWRRTGVYDALAEHYDHLVVYGNATFYDPVRSYELPPAVAARARFVDYVCNDDEAPADSEQTADGQPFVLVTIGGGDGGGDTVIEPFLQMMQTHRHRLPFRAEVLTGPFVAPEVERRLRALAQGLPVRLQKFIPSTAALLRGAELVIATAGYNTTTDVLSMARRALLIPRVLYRQEQWIRARRLAELGLVGCLHPDQVTPDALFTAVQDAMRDTPLLRARAQGLPLALPLDGARNFAAFCGSLSVRA